MRIHCLQHVPFEGPGAIADWATAGGHALRITHLYRGDELPSLDDFDRLAVMGGPMGVYDEGRHGWLSGEKEFLRTALDGGKSIVGVCLGAQLLADVLGARVYRGPHKEIGWFPIELTDAGAGCQVFGELPRRLQVFHWHGDTFDLPAGADHLAYSDGCRNQAFLYGRRVLALQFHVESTPASVRAIVESCGDEIRSAPYVQSAEEMLSVGRDAFASINRVLFTLLDRLQV